MKIIRVTDHGMWRGHHSWTIVLEDDDNGRSAVSARGDSRQEAVADAKKTMANRRIFSPEEKAALTKSNQALRKALL